MPSSLIVIEDFMEPMPPSFESFPLVDAIDHEILMHRDAHFGGLFSIMLDYYRNEGKGVQPDFDIERIERLKILEEQMKENIAALFLSGDEMQKVADSREAYQNFRAIYEVKKPKSIHPRLIADLILTEDLDGDGEVDAVAAEKGAIVPALIELLQKEELYDPLFPGYGLAPSLIVRALEKIGDKRAIIALFEAIGQGDFFADEQILKALKEIGAPAKEFLLKVLHGRPFNEDNEKAAIAIIAFKDHPDVAETCFKMLQDPDVLTDPCLSTYLVLACVGLDPKHHEEFKSFGEKTKSKTLKEDIKSIVHTWEEEGQK
jgi:hypothetical protein